MSNLPRAASGPIPVKQHALLALLTGKGDVPITELFDGIRNPGTPEYDLQGQQRWLTPYIAALNKNLAEKGLRVEPGALKNTYRLVVLTT